MTSAVDRDSELRTAVFGWLDEQTRLRDELTWAQLQRGFAFDGKPLALVTQRGIRRVAGLDAALAFQTTYTPPGGRAPYADAEGPDGLIRYKYQGVDPQGPDNRAMRAALQRGLPLVWFVGVAPGVFLAQRPVWLVGDEPSDLQFAVALDEEQYLAARSDAPLDLRQRSVLRLTRLRLHQPVFRAQVLRAYDVKCSICRLKHENLLDAAHIQPDAEGGQPVVTNGLSLCKIHHAAYDAGIVGIDPAYRIEVRNDVLREVDGPMLRHGLQDVHGWRPEVPRRIAERPDRDRLAQRYARFRQAS